MQNLVQFKPLIVNFNNDFDHWPEPERMLYLDDCMQDLKPKIKGYTEVEKK